MLRDVNDMSELNLEIVTPEKVFFSGEVEMAVLKTPDGEMGVLKNHMPIVVIESAGPCRFLKGGKWFKADISEGFAEIRLNKIIIFTHDAQWETDIQ